MNNEKPNPCIDGAETGTTLSGADDEVSRRLPIKPKSQQMEQKLAELTARAKQRAGSVKTGTSMSGKTYQLPLWDNLERGIPNHLARSSLFAPIARGRRKQHDKSVIASRDDVKIYFTGHQLDMADCDVFMQALHEAHRAPLGKKVFINRKKFLSEIGRSCGKSDYEWLHEAFRRLFLGSLEIEAKRYKIGGTPKSSGLHLVEKYDFDPDQDGYYIVFDERILAMFSNREFALIDWEKRLELKKRVDMAKWLQNYIASHETGIHRIGLKYLKAWMDYSSPMNKFMEAIDEAMRELERLEIISGARIEKSTRKEIQACWTKL